MRSSSKVTLARRSRQLAVASSVVLVVIGVVGGPRAARLRPQEMYEELIALTALMTSWGIAGAMAVGFGWPFVSLPRHRFLLVFGVFVFEVGALGFVLFASAEAARDALALGEVAPMLAWAFSRPLILWVVAEEMEKDAAPRERLKEIERSGGSDADDPAS